MLREDADGREAREEGGVGIRQAKDDRAQIGRPHLDAGPGGDQAGVAAEVGGENLFDGEGHIEGAHGSAVVPAELGVETEGVGAAVLADFGKRGEIGKQAAIVPRSQETGEYEPGEILIDGIIEGEEGVDSLRGADNALDVDAALGSGRCRERLRRLLLGEAQQDHNENRCNGACREHSRGEEGAPRVRNRAKHEKRLPLGLDAQEGHEEEHDDQNDGGLEERLLEATLGPVDGAAGHAAEGRAEAGALDLQQDRTDEQRRDDESGWRSASAGGEHGLFGGLAHVFERSVLPAMVHVEDSGGEFLEVVAVAVFAGDDVGLDHAHMLEYASLGVAESDGSGVESTWEGRRDCCSR